MKNHPLRILHYYVIVSILVAIIVVVLKRTPIDLPLFISGYLNDLLVIPIVATIGINVVWIVKKDQQIRLNIFTITTVVLIFSIAFEYYLPRKTDFYIADIWDVVCYSLGGIIFYFLQRIENPTG